MSSGLVNVPEDEPAAASEKAEINVLVIEDNDFDKAYLKTMLTSDDETDYKLVFVSAITVAFMRAKLEKFDIILLDFQLPDGTALEFISNYKDHIDIPIIVITGYKLKKIESMVLTSGASDYIPKDDLSEELIKRMIKFSLQRHKSLLEAKDQAMKDPLTGCYNRLALDKFFQVNVKISQKKKKLSALMLIDFDRFKNINDMHGHIIGDEALKCVTKTLKQFAARRDDKDFLIRFGGDEFIYLTTELEDREQITDVAEALIEKHKAPFQLHEESLLLPLSIGIAVYDDEYGDLEQFIRCADAALYKAKKLRGSSYEMLELSSFNGAAVQGEG